MLALETQALCCKKINLPPESITGRGIYQPWDWAISEEAPPALVELPSWHLVEQRWITPTEPWSNGTFVSKINYCCFILLSFELVCFIEMDSWTISLEYELAVYFALDNEVWKKCWCTVQSLGNQFHLSILPLDPGRRWETYAQPPIAPINSNPTSRNVSKTILDQSAFH